MDIKMIVSTYIMVIFGIEGAPDRCVSAPFAAEDPGVLQAVGAASLGTLLAKGHMFRFLPARASHGPASASRRQRDDRCR